jgi:hypothetical protein
MRPFQQNRRMDSLQLDAEIVRRMRPEQKLAVMNTLIRQAWELKAALVRARNPGLSGSETWARACRMVAGERP